MQGRIVSYAQHDLTQTEAEVMIAIMEVIVDGGQGTYPPEQIALAEDWLQLAHSMDDKREFGQRDNRK